MKHKILVASTNPGKLSELKAMLDADIRWVGPGEFTGIGDQFARSVYYGRYKIIPIRTEFFDI